MKLLRRILAFLHLSDRLVCAESRNSTRDYHDYPDDVCGEPWHMVKLECRRCGKEFMI